MSHHNSKAGELRKLALCSLKQPMTAKQLSKHIGTDLDRCSSIIEDLAKDKIVECLNSGQKRSRLYYSTNKGRILQEELLHEYGKSSRNIKLNKDKKFWHDYGFICFSHRTAIIKTLPSAMELNKMKMLSPAGIKRKAKYNDLTLTMSANNVRDALRELFIRGIVEKRYVRKRKYPLYCLSVIGNKFKELLVNAEKVDYDLVRAWENNPG